MVVVAIILSLAGRSIFGQIIVRACTALSWVTLRRSHVTRKPCGPSRSFPLDLRLVSNETAAVLLYTDRSAYEIPRRVEGGDMQPLSVPFGSGSSDLDQAYRDGVRRWCCLTR